MIIKHTVIEFISNVSDHSISTLASKDTMIKLLQDSNKSNKPILLQTDSDTSVIIGRAFIDSSLIKISTVTTEIEDDGKDKI